MTLRLLTLSLLLFALSAGAGELRIGGGAAPIENILKRVKDAFEKESGITLQLNTAGPSNALKELDQGKLDAAVGGVSFNDWMEMMAKEGYVVADKNSYANRVIGRDMVRVLTHKDVTVSELSKEQLKGIFTGTIVNWKDVGGADLKITVVHGAQIPGTNTVFQKQVLDGAAYSKETLAATNMEDVKAKITATPGAIGLGALAQVDASVGAPKIPEVGRPIVMITRGAPSAELEKLLEFIKGPGQKLIVR